MPEEITALFASGHPTDNNLTVLCNVLHPLLLDIPYNEDGTHNLIGLI